VKPALTRAEVALDTAVVEPVPPAGGVVEEDWSAVHHPDYGCRGEEAQGAGRRAHLTGSMEGFMSTFILMSKLTPELTRDLSRRHKVGQEWKREIEEKCPGVKWLGHYMLLGPYDFVDIYEAPDEETAAKVSLITMSRGALKAESWTAIPYARFLDLAEEIE
jgi:uncharacterized protein with GYD domain